MFLGKVDYNKFTFETKVEKGDIMLFLNGKEVLKVGVGSYYGNYGNYFKSGDYLQTNKGIEYNIVHIYSLTVHLNGPCQYYA